MPDIGDFIAIAILYADRGDRRKSQSLHRAQLCVAGLRQIPPNVFGFSQKFIWQQLSLIFNYSSDMMFPRQQEFGSHACILKF